MAPHRSPMTIYLKSRGRHGIPVSPEILTKSKKWGCTKYVASVVNCSDCILSNAWHHNGTTQKSHDHLFKNSRQAWLAIFALKHWQRLKSEVISLLCNEICCQLVNCSDCILRYAWHCNGATQKSHDHLFKKSRQAWLTSFALKYWQNLKNWGYIIAKYLICCQNSKLFWLCPHICLAL